MKFFWQVDKEIDEKYNYLLFGRNSETKRYNVSGPTGVMLVMHRATNAPLTKIQAMSRDAARMQVASKIKEA